MADLKTGDVVRIVKILSDYSAALTEYEKYKGTVASIESVDINARYPFKLKNIPSRWNAEELEKLNCTVYEPETSVASWTLTYDFDSLNELKKEKSIMASVTDKIKVLAMTGSKKEQYKAGFVDADGDLTDTGDDALQEVLRVMADEKLTELAVKLNQEDEKKKAKK